MSLCVWLLNSIRKRVWRYQSGTCNQNPYIEKEQTTQEEKVHKDKRRSTKHTYKTKDRVTRTQQKKRKWINTVAYVHQYMYSI